MLTSSEVAPYRGAVESHLQWVNETSAQFEGFCGASQDSRDSHKPFLPIGLLQRRFSDNGAAVLKELLDAIGLKRWTQDAISKQYAAVFAILLDINHPDYIDHFMNEGLKDAKLPFSTDHHRLPIHNDIHEKFERAQWRYCAFALEDTQDSPRRYANEAIFQFKREPTPIRRGSSADIFKIQTYDRIGRLVCHCVFLPYNKLTVCEDAGYKILKTYTSSHAKKDRQTEEEALRHQHLRSCPAVVDFHGSFEHGETHYIVLEYADKGSLQNFFATEQPPTKAKEVLAFWERFFELCRALMFVHDTQTPRKSQENMYIIAHTSISFQHQLTSFRWHQDIKLDNILVFTTNEIDEYPFSFKLADFGHSHLKHVDALCEPLDFDSGGDKTYGQTFMPPKPSCTANLISQPLQSVTDPTVTQTNCTSRYLRLLTYGRLVQ
jgi:serine/threonine protein kinase